MTPELHMVLYGSLASAVIFFAGRCYHWRMRALYAESVIALSTSKAAKRQTRLEFDLQGK